MVDVQRLHEKGGRVMNAEHLRFIQKMYWLLQDCGMPNQMPSRELFYDLFHMIQEHAEYTGLDLE
jgi:hypothetical protein